MAGGIVGALFGSYDLRTSRQWRDEDMAYREQEAQWRQDDLVRAHEWRVADLERRLRRVKLEHETLICDARADQLQTVSEQCALLCGFTVVAMTNVGVPRDVPQAVVFAYATTATLVCVLLLLATVSATLLLLAVTRYMGHTLPESVRRLDRAQLLHEHECVGAEAVEVVDQDHALVVAMATSPFGVWWLRRCEREQVATNAFMVVGVLLFFVYLGVLAWIQYTTSAVAATSISVLCLVGLLAWQLRLASRWRYLLAPHPQMSSQGLGLDADAGGGSSLRMDRSGGVGSLSGGSSLRGRRVSSSTWPASQRQPTDTSTYVSMDD